MQRHDHGWFSARCAQRCKGELKFASCIAGYGKFQGTNPHGVQSLRIIETQVTERHTAVGSKLQGHGGNMTAGPLNAAGGEHVRK
jgi:hypothetical protein